MTSIANIYQPWDIVVVPFPFTSGTDEKRRPALIVSADILASRHGLYWLLMITSTNNSRWECDIEISDLRATGLPHPSVVRPAKITTLQGDRILGKIGLLPKKDRLPVKKMLTTFII